MDIKIIGYLKNIQHFGSINRAALACHISQSRLSTLINQLESELGFKLLNRSTAGVVFTEGGLAFLELAEKILIVWNQICEIPDTVKKNNGLGVACSPDAFLIDAFVDFEREYSCDASDCKLIESGLREILQLVKTDECQLGIMAVLQSKASKYAKLANRNGLIFKPIELNIPMCAVMNPNHILAHQESVRVDECANYIFVSDAKVDYDDTLAVFDISLYKKTILVSSLMGLFELLKKNDYISAQLLTMRDHVQVNGLCLRPFSDFNDTSGFYMLHASDSPLTDNETAFLQFLKKRLQVFREAERYIDYPS